MHARFHAKPELAGKLVTCPSCGQAFKVPQPQVPVASVRATCQCGRSFAAKPELSGKLVKCPSCGQPLSVPHPDTATAPIRVACQCGKTFQAKPELAGRRVKCPSCAQPLTIPTPAAPAPAPETADPLGFGGPNSDPLGLGTAAEDPLGLGGAVADPLSNFPSAGLPTAATTLPGPAATAPVTQRRKRKQDGLVTAAGVVAICYGGYQVLASAVGIVVMIISAVKVAGVAGGMGLATIAASVGFTILFLALGVWLAILGLQILREDRGALERAGQVSMIYVALAILGLLLSLVSILRAPSLGLWVILSAVRNLIYVGPPAFILYVEKQRPSSR